MKNNDKEIIALLDEALAHFIMEEKKAELQKSELKLNYLAGLLCIIGVIIYFKTFI